MYLQVYIVELFTLKLVMNNVGTLYAYADILKELFIY